MKSLRIIVTILFFSLLMGSMSSCLVTRHTDNGKHKGWFYRQHNHHHKKTAVIVVTPDHRYKKVKHRR